MIVYVMTPALRRDLHAAVDGEAWDGGYRAECHAAVDLWPDGPVVSRDPDLPTDELYALGADEDGPDPHLLGLLAYFGVPTETTTA